MADVKPPTFDLSPLHDEIDTRAAREFEARFGQTPELVVRARAAAVADTVGFFLWILVCVATVTISLAMRSENPRLDEPIERFAMGMVLIIPASILFFLLYVPLISLVAKRKQQRFAGYRLSRFAEANGMRYCPRVEVDEQSLAFDVIRSEGRVPFEVGNLHLSVVEGRQATDKEFALGYVAVRLPQPMPHIVLDATSNNIALSLGETLTSEQKLGLEGDFDAHFALYCAKGYERDALYLFTPDVMASFIDGAGALDAEFRGDVLFLYSENQLSTLEKDRWALVERALGAVLPQLRSWQRWRESGTPGEPWVAPTMQPKEEPPAETRGEDDAPTLLISLRAAELSTTALKRRVPLWVRFVQFGVVAYAVVLLSLALILD